MCVRVRMCVCVRACGNAVVGRRRRAFIARPFRAITALFMLFICLPRESVLWLNYANVFQTILHIYVCALTLTHTHKHTHTCTQRCTQYRTLLRAVFGACASIFDHKTDALPLPCRRCVHGISQHANGEIHALPVQTADGRAASARSASLATPA